MSKTVHRIIDLISELKLSARQFDISIGTANGYILRMQKNNASVGSDVIERIVKEYPQVNLVWLITGKGDMFISEQQKPKVRTNREIEAYIDNKLKSKWSDEKKALLDEILKEIEDLKK
ncbi:hypothetical protein [Psychroserpens ponticola]|uniref:XRE family transcriptional regulator n=1 Tax=Psychroserpens ponticola TaxID=2932268 RepID=A0ABY7S1Q2_9FLAO|nr:hypothetical protein [Psychroserpens ponticola]WCO03109.1 hypothetical protein MUN68_006350 [Psychroserpens ponticola]